MTCVIYDHLNKQIAIDSRITSSGVIETDSYDKTIKNEKGLWFFCGATCDFKILSELKHNDEVKVLPDCHSLLLSDGKVFLVGVYEDKRCCYSELTYSAAIGSGRKFALSAIDFNKKAKGAVEYSATRDIHTGGKIRVFNLDGKEV